MRRALVALLAVLAVLGIAGAALAAFPGSDPDESVRVNTPDDPAFDRCEPDDEDGRTDCSNVYDEQYERFGFAPAASENTARYKDPARRERQREQNAKAGRNPLGQLPGISADRAWKRSVGRPDVEVAILDTGIRWRDESLRTKVALNAGELPRPRRGAEDCAADDCDGDGAFTVDDFAQDPRVAQDAGTSDEEQADAFLDGSDLIAAFSDGRDDDANGYPDDVAGWDFFDDDNDPYDASSYSSASNHGTGRAQEAAQQTNEGKGGTGVCPRCRIVPLRIWDSFVVPTDNFALGATYAADNEIEVVEAAIGGLTFTRFVRDAMRDAYRRGVFFAVVSSDLNTSDHNSPTTYDEAMMVAGTVADTQGLGQSGAEVGAFLGELGIPTSAPISTWFRNSGTTQYGEHGHVVMPAVTGSQATGQASGAAGLVASYGRERGVDLQPNEIKQLLTLTAEDVVPENTTGIGVPDPSQPGWDRHFGYGRVDLGAALDAVAAGRVPPQALITGPPWFSPYEVGRTASVPIQARLAAPRGGSYRYALQWAPGAEPAEAEFRTISEGSRSEAVEATVGTVDVRAVRAALDARPGGGSSEDPTEPAQPPGDVDPNEPAFTVRVVVTDERGVRGEDRKLLFAYRDQSLKDGFPLRLDTGGEASPRLWDVDGDRRLDVVLADSSGRLRVLRADGTRVPSFNGGRAVRTKMAANVRTAAPAFRRLKPPRETLRTPAIGDIDGDRRAEIVDSAGEHVYAWELDGSPVSGFPVRLNPAFSEPKDRTRDNHVKRGFLASPVLADLTGDGALEITVPALDQHLYAWDGRGRALPGFPRELASEGVPGAEIITTPAVGDLVAGGRPEIVTPTAEFDDSAGSPEPPAGVAGAFGEIVTGFLSQAIGGSGRTYAVDAAGALLDGWPAKPVGIVPDALPLVAPSYDHVMGDLDADGDLEVVGGLVTGEVQAYDRRGRAVTTYDSQPAGGEHVDRSKVLNLFENPLVADLDGRPGLEVVRGGVTLNQAVNLGVAVGQNLPYNHVVQAWEGASGRSLPAFPQAVEDYQLLTSPAVADVSDAPGVELLVGTGLYLLRNINASGQEGSGWPKFTGGWIFAVPAVGDMDGDGRLELVTMTREGNVFAWDSGRPACGGNDEWWTSRHDERSTGTHGTDTRPPAVPAGLSARRAEDGRVAVALPVPGDDWACGRAERVRVQALPGTAAGAAATSSATFAVPAQGDRLDQAVRLPAGTRRVEVSAVDEAGNWSLPARVDVRAATATSPSTGAGSGSSPSADSRNTRAPAGAAAGAGDSAGSLPFTGLAIGVLLLVGALMLGAGITGRLRLR